MNDSSKASPHVKRDIADDVLDPKKALVPVTIKVNEQRVARGFWPKVRRVASKIPFASDLIAVWYCARDPETPATAKGLIVNLLDQRVLKPGPTFISYGVAKAGLWALTQALALALAPQVRVNGIGPGYMLPDAGQSEADFRKWVERQPLRNGGTPEAAASALRFIIAAPSMTGQIIALDGGQHLA